MRMFAHLWKSFARHEGRPLRLLGVLILAMITLSIVAKQLDEPVNTVTIDLALEPKTQAFLERIEAKGPPLQGRSAPPLLPQPSGEVSSSIPISSARESASSPSPPIGEPSMPPTIQKSLNPRVDVRVSLRRKHGAPLYPRHHFTPGSMRLVIDERRFQPGYYDLEIIARNPVTGETESITQPFAWGVLAINADQDSYTPGADAEIHMGVLDERGDIVCDAELMLDITDPNGKKETLTTGDRSILVTGTCGVKQAGFLRPDYRTSYHLDTVGTYTLHLTAFTRGRTVTTDTVIRVSSNPLPQIRRTAATRLWPFAPSTMSLDVYFPEAFRGSITDIVPKGFRILSTMPKANVGENSTTGDLLIRWNGSWNAGDHVSLSYEYDAPDISPQFYLIGPLELHGRFHPSNMKEWQEGRMWQIANDGPSAATNYVLRKDVMGAGGGEQALSALYRLSDTIGEPGIGWSASDTYVLEGGYRNSEDAFVSLQCWTSLFLGSIPGVGQATGEAACTAMSDSPWGYALSWQVTTGSGGTSTGYMINPYEATIAPLIPAMPNTPETWSINPSTSAWGARLSSLSTHTETMWGVDMISEKWLNVGSGSSFAFLESDVPTDPAGATEILQFRTEVGTNKVQQAGTYEVNIDIFLQAL